MSLGTILLTGGSRGLGRSMVTTLVRYGATVAFTYRSDEALAREVAAEHDGRAHPYFLELEDAAAPRELVSRVEEDHGPLTTLVNNAGVRKEALLAMMRDEDWSTVIETNLAGAFRCCRAVVPGMIFRRNGSIINISSLSAFHGVKGQAAYAAAKAGLLGMTRSLAREIGRKKVRVNAVAPGFVMTEMTSELPETAIKMLRSGECLPSGVDIECVSETVAFLASPASASITGQCIVVDAGASA